MNVIFIASLSHSGSTLLDLMLNAHPEIASVGELKQLSRFARFTKKKEVHRCTCGVKSVLVCPFWSEVSARTQKSIGRKIDQLNVEDYEARESFDRDNVALFNAIAITAGKQFVVDSSKSRSRLQLLMANSKLTVFPIFLLRNPKGQIYSSLKRQRSASAFARLIGDYVVTNRQIYTIIKRRRHAVVHYEQLVRDPEGTLSPVLQQLGVAFHSRQLDWGAQQRHNVGGNHMRWIRTSELQLDEAWRGELSLTQKLAIDVATIPGRFPLLKFLPGSWETNADEFRGTTESSLAPPNAETAE